MSLPITVLLLDVLPIRLRLPTDWLLLPPTMLNALSFMLLDRACVIRAAEPPPEAPSESEWLPNTMLPEPTALAPLPAVMLPEPMAAWLFATPLTWWEAFTVALPPLTTAELEPAAMLSKPPSTCTYEP